MNLANFRASLTDTQPTTPYLPLRAMWYAAQGDWHQAHDLLQDDNTPHGAWVHAYLHRKEPDAANAAYWYRRAGKPVASGSFEAEWDAIVAALLAEEPNGNS